MERKLTKEEIKGPDAFISNMSLISEWLYANRTIISVALAVAAVASLVWAAVGVMNSRKEDTAQEALFKAEKAYQTENDLFKKPETPAVQKGKDAKTAEKGVKPAATKTGDLNVDYKTAVPALKDVISHYPGTQAAVIAAIDLSNLDYEYKKYDDEMPLLQQALKDADHPVTKALALNGLGLAYEAKGDCNNAISQWQKIQDDKNMAAFKADALVKTGLCYEKLGQKDKAAEIYGRFDSADKQLRQITENMARAAGVNPQLPMEIQDPKSVQKLQNALGSSSEYQELQALLSDRSSVKAAKKYLTLLKKG